MKPGTPVVAIFDIRKTNKKFLLFDRDYHVVYETAAAFEPALDDEGEPCENLPVLATWMKQALDEALFDKRFHIKALNFSAYGASFVHLDKRGIPATPLYSYLKLYPENLLHTFYEKYGDKESFALATASPPLGMLNSGLQLYWLKHHKPALFKKIKCSLHLPQFCSYLFTNKPHAEMTSIGCHTALWDFRRKEYHNWVLQEDLHKLFPPVSPTSTKMDIPLGKYRFCAGIGIHDSSAALIPYLSSVPDPFLLLSTGTWSISLNPFNEEALTAGDLNKDCLSFMSPDGKPVKASRLFLGNEHDYYEKKIATYFGKDASYHKSINFDKKIVQKLLYENNSRKKFIPQTMDVGGYLSFKKSKTVDLSLFQSYEEAYHQLNIDLIAMQAMAMETAMGNTAIGKIYITGGFCENTIFVQLLACRFPDTKVYTAPMKEASALGAALIMHNSWNDSKETHNLLNFERYPPQKDIAILQYAF
jgi:sugar (pentulose or hexulose) kinase